MLVPYEPPRCRRSENGHSSRRSFADFLRRGGKIDPINLGAADYDAQERVPLFATKEEQTLEMLRLQVRQSRITQFAVIAALAISMVVFLGLGVLVWRVNSNLSAMEAQIAPHADLIVNSTVGMMGELGGSFHNVHDITAMTKELAAANMGPSGPAGRAINSTALIAERVAKFLSHPTLKLSLGDDE
jgi:hypothetical protein